VFPQQVLLKETKASCKAAIVSRDSSRADNFSCQLCGVLSYFHFFYFIFELSADDKVT
jgi:hypothetical protein